MKYVECYFLSCDKLSGKTCILFQIIFEIDIFRILDNQSLRQNELFIEMHKNQFTSNIYTQQRYLKK